jgi:hypothetical protein
MADVVKKLFFVTPKHFSYVSKYYSGAVLASSSEDAISTFIKMFCIKNEEPSYFCAAETECIIDEKVALYLEKEQDKWIKSWLDTGRL